MLRRFSVALAALVPFTFTADAYGHAPPQGEQLVWQKPEADAIPVVVTNRGLLFPNGELTDLTFSVRCNEAYDARSATVPQVFTDADNALVVATSERVATTPDRACAWRESSGLPQVPDADPPRGVALGVVAQAPDEPRKLLVSTQDYQNTSQVFASEDYGQSWSAVASTPPQTVYKVLIAGSGGRVYASGDRFDMALKKLVPVWASSNDFGKTWSETVLESARVALWVPPGHADVVFARGAVRGVSPASDQLLRSSDGGKTFEALGTFPPITALVSTDDGNTVFLGTDIGQLASGLHRSTDGGRTFTHLKPAEVLLVTCLSYRQERLWLCANMAPNSDGVWVSSDQGETLREIVDFDPRATKANMRASCEDPAAEALCDVLWHDYKVELLDPLEGDGEPEPGAPRPDIGGPKADAGARDAATGPHLVDEPDGAPADGGVRAPTPASSSDGGCSVGIAPAGSAPRALWLFSVLLALVYVRRTRRGA